MKETLSHEECLRSVFEYEIRCTDSGSSPPDKDISIRAEEMLDVFPSVQVTREYDSDDTEQRRSCISCIANKISVLCTRICPNETFSTPKSFRRIYSSCKLPRQKKSHVNSAWKSLLVICCLLLALVASLYVYYNSWTAAVSDSRKDTKTELSYSHASNSAGDNATARVTASLTQTRRKLPREKRGSLGNPYNPETWSNKTASTRQRYLILYWSKIRGHKARIQRKIEYEKDNHIWPYTYAGDGTCPVACELTNDRGRAHEASAFVVHSRLTDVWDFPPLEHLAPWILQNNENPVYTPALSDPQIMNKFNLLISYRLDSDFPSPIYPMPTTSKPIPFNERLGDVLAVFSKCEHVRTEYMRQLMKFIDVHSYGACLKNKDGLIGLYGQVNGKYVFKDYKLVLTRFYKFSLVFMNQDCPYFVDDRLYHALDTGSIPVYMGTEKIDEFLPGNLKGSVIKVSDFNSPKELADYLKYLSKNETAYNKYLEWKTTGIGDISNTTIGRWWHQKYPLFCQVCMRLSQGNLHPGLNVDTCKPRQYLDWNLYPPYGTGSETQVVANVNNNNNNHNNNFYVGTEHWQHWQKTYIILLMAISMLLLASYSLVLLGRLYHFLHRF